MNEKTDFCPEERLLIVNADDFGHYAIHERGDHRSVSKMEQSKDRYAATYLPA